MIDEGGIKCPNCGEDLEFYFSCDECGDEKMLDDLIYQKAKRLKKNEWTELKGRYGDDLSESVSGRKEQGADAEL